MFCNRNVVSNETAAFKAAATHVDRVPQPNNGSAGFVNVYKTKYGTQTVPRLVLLADKTSTQKSGVN